MLSHWYFLLYRFCSVYPFKVLLHQVVVVRLQKLVAAVEFQERWWKTGTRPSTSSLRSFIKGNLNGQFQTVSCESHWGWQLLKFSYLPTDLSLNVLGICFLTLVTCSSKIPVASLSLDCSNVVWVLQAYDWKWEKPA